MSTFRVPPRKHFTMLSNVAVRDPRTSYKAKGLLGTMLSFDPDWVFRKKHLLTLMKDGKAALNTGIQELIETGYVVRNEQTRLDRGRFGSSDYDVFDYPHGNPLPPETPDPEATNPEGSGTLRLLADHRYVKIRNEALRDPALTNKAVGILQTMLSFPPNWNFSEEYLENFATDRIDSIRAGLKELMAARYIVRLEQQRNDKGYFGPRTYIVADYRLGTEADPQRHQTLKLITTPTSSAQGNSVLGKSARGDTVLGKSGHGESVLGKSVHGESVHGKSVHGKSAPKKTVPKKTVEKKTISKKSSSAPATITPRPAQPTTTTQGGERKGLDPKITATFKALLPRLLADDPRRNRAWNGLSAQQQDAAFRRAQERKKEPHEQKAFSTVLKEELDIESNLARSATTPATSQDQRDGAAIGAAAQQRWEEVFAAALDEGLPTDEATQLADKARLQLLAPGYDTALPEGSTAASSPVDAAPQPQAQRALTRAVLLVLGHELFKLYNADRRRSEAWGKLTQQEQEAALLRAQGPNKESGNDKAFVKALVTELDAAAGLNATREASEQSAVIPKGDRL